ncbi:hypothetical protein IC229_24385 [Spirosoma sp. BT702]|uniref:Uncharacterized protein n=1 Tax=Spirosoma profusum TaxID=2771354 RepID=A0A926XZR7_9BACT|nr:hypothetical protein [Spirosoma profusum]MBD2703807.1 hypothetical protein [Spirosoma profusum]
MSTGQKYSGKGDSTTLFQPSAQITLQTSSLADERPEPVINPQIFEAQTQLLQLTDRFAAIGDEPVQHIDTLLTHWLSTPADALSVSVDVSQLHRIHLLIDFLTQLDHSPALSKA